MPRLPASGLLLPGRSGNGATADHHNALNISGDIDIRVKATNVLSLTGGYKTIIARYAYAANLWTITLYGTSSALYFKFYWSEDGTAPTTYSLETTAGTLSALGLSGGRSYWFRVAFDVDNGAGGATASFYYSADDAATWTLIEARTRAGTTHLHTANHVTEIGVQSGTTGFWPGQIERAQVLNGIDGPAVFDADFTKQQPGIASFTESANGATVTINSSATAPAAGIVGRGAA